MRQRPQKFDMPHVGARETVGDKQQAEAQYRFAERTPGQLQNDHDRADRDEKFNRLRLECPRRPNYDLIVEIDQVTNTESR